MEDEEEQQEYETMCKGLQGIADDARKEGIKEGINRNFEMIKMILEGKDFNEITEICDISLEKVEEIGNLLKKKNGR